MVRGTRNAGRTWLPPAFRPSPENLPLCQWSLRAALVVVGVLCRQALSLGVLRGDLLGFLRRDLGWGLRIRHLIPHHRVAFFAASLTLPAAFFTLPVAVFTPPLT